MINLDELPEVVLYHIFSYLSYDDVAQYRIICKCFNNIGWRVLNQGFSAAEKYNSKCLREVKMKLPRRESERRDHPLTKLSEIYIAIETRINMLSMTYSKWIKNSMCCFIPGKVLDEMFSVLRQWPMCHLDDKSSDALQELRDLSSMAMEHFEERILPTLRRNYFYATSKALSDCTECLFTSYSVDASGSLSRQTNLDQYLHFVSQDVSFASMSMSEPDSSSSFVDLTPAPSQPVSANSVTHSEYQRLMILNSVLRKKIQAQSIILANQGKEIMELRTQVEDWENKLRLLCEHFHKVDDLPLNHSSECSLLSNYLSQPKRRFDSGDTPSTSKLPRINEKYDMFMDD